MYARIWYEPSGAVKVTTFIDVPDPEMIARILHQDGQVDPNATFDDCATEPELTALLPSSRADRTKWRKNPNGRGVIVDLTIPDPPHPRQALLDAIQGATTIAQLKALLIQTIRGDK